MTIRILDRSRVRGQPNEVEQPASVTPVPELRVVRPDENAKTKVSVAPKVKRTRAKKAPPRMRARWGLFDGTMKQVAIFDYNQRAVADTRLAELLAKMKGSHLLQIVKEPMVEPAPSVEQEGAPRRPKLRKSR